MHAVAFDADEGVLLLAGLPIRQRLEIAAERVAVDGPARLPCPRPLIVGFRRDADEIERRALDEESIATAPATTGSPRATLVLLLSWWLLGRRVTLRQMAALGVSYAGVLVVFGQEAHMAGAEVLLVTPSADFFASPHMEGLMGYAKVFHEAGVSWTLSTHAAEAANFGIFIGST